MASVEIRCNGDKRRSEQGSCTCSSSSVDKLKMDDNISDHRRSVSENTNESSWSNSWDVEDGSLSRLNMETSEELQNLMEDREIASRAVAFVVNSTRKGFVPLCANVASLMKSKRRLEKKVGRLKREVEILRSLNPNGSSKRPTPTSLDSLSSDKDVFLDPAHIQVFSDLLKENYRGSSASCSQSSSSSQVSNSPKPSKKNAKAAPNTSDNGAHVVSVLVHQSNDNLPNHKSLKPDSREETDQHVDPSVLKCRKKLSPAGDGNLGQALESESRSTCAGRTKNLPGLLVSDGDRPRVVSSQQGLSSDALRVNGHCDHGDASNVNVLLAGELAASRLEIERLTLRLKQYEVRDGLSSQGQKGTPEDLSTDRLSSCSCRKPSKPCTVETVVEDRSKVVEDRSKVADDRSKVADDRSKERRLSDYADSCKSKESRCSTARHPKLQNASQSSKDGSDVSHESLTRESQCDDTESKSQRMSLKSPPSGRGQARPLHRSKALNRQSDLSKIKYIHSIEPSSSDDRYLV